MLTWVSSIEYHELNRNNLHVQSINIVEQIMEGQSTEAFHEIKTSGEWFFYIYKHYNAI